MKQNTLDDLRAKIDMLDSKIQSLIAERAELVVTVARVKKQFEKQNSFYRPERESQVLNTIMQRNNSLLSGKDMAHIFREIMSACLALEQQLNIAYLGPEGTFTQEAAFKHFGHAISTLDCSSIEDVFFQVAKSNANYGLVPIENSYNGVVGNTIDMLYSQNLKICGEVEVLINHHLMMLDKKQEIKIIYAHRQALGQCYKWLHKNYPNVELEAVSSNALAARMVVNKPNAAAIASEVALDLYGLTRVAKNIEDLIGNSTRFLVLGKEDIPPSSKDKTSILVVTKHKAGALLDILEPFKDNNINMLQLARHPINGVKWEYIFLIDIDGHQQQSHIKDALHKVSNRAVKVNILGSYPFAVL